MDHRNAAKKMTVPNWLQKIGTRAFVWAERHQLISWFLPLILGGYGFFHYYNEKPFLEYDHLPFEVTQPFVKAGDVIPLRVYRCNHSSTPQTYLIARTVENLDTGRQYVLSDSIVRLEPGCHEEVSLANQIPPSVPAGRYRILGLSQIATDFRVIYVPWSSQPFQVIS
jgi:hypothetical protein